MFPREDIGILMSTDRSYIPKVEAQLSLESTEATFEQLPYLFEMGVRTVTPTTSSPITYTYEFPISSTDTAASLATYTFRGGDNVAVEQFAYGFCRSFTLTGAGGQALMMSGEIIGRQVLPGSFTAAATIPTVEEILFSKGKLYIDGSATWPATTQKEHTLLDMSLSVTGGWTPVYTADGATHFSFLKQVEPEIVLTVTFEHDAEAVAEKAAWRAGTARSIKLDFEGSAATKNLEILIAGKWDNFQKLGERDGNDIVQGTLRALYNATSRNYFKATIKTGANVIA